MNLYLLVAATCTAAAVASLIIALSQALGKDVLRLRVRPVARRLRELARLGSASPAMRPIQVELEPEPRNLGERTLFFFGRLFMPRESAQMPLRASLTQAGWRRRNAIAAFYGAKGLLATALPVVAAAVGGFSGLGAARLAGFVTLSAIVGYYLPNWWLPRRVRRRQAEIAYHLPDTLDMLLVCIEAGLGLDAALMRVAREQHRTSPVLSQEFSRVNQEMMAGKARQDALRDLARRTGAEDLYSFVAMLIQTERLGTSLANTLRSFNDSLRVKRRQEAEEAASKTTVKLVFPLVMCIFPAVFVVLLGPVVVQFVAIIGSR